MTVIARHCVVKKNLHYYRSRINDGKCEFKARDTLFVAQPDFARLAAKGFVVAVEDEFREVIASESLFYDWFPRTAREIWVFGDGPTAATWAGKIPANAITFAVNRCMFSPLELIPDYYCALDNVFFKPGWEMKKDFVSVDILQDLMAKRKFTKRGNVDADKLGWPELRQYDVLGETGFSDHLGEVYHGKTSAYIALQLAVQCGRPFRDNGLEIHIAGVDLMNLRMPDGTIRSHHYGKGEYQEPLYARMLNAFRYGLNFLNEAKINWVNHSSLLASRIADLEGDYGRSEL